MAAGSSGERLRAAAAGCGGLRDTGRACGRGRRRSADVAASREPARRCSVCGTCVAGSCRRRPRPLLEHPAAGASPPAARRRGGGPPGRPRGRRGERRRRTGRPDRGDRVGPAAGRHPRRTGSSSAWSTCPAIFDSLEQPADERFRRGPDPSSSVTRRQDASTRWTRRCWRSKPGAAGAETIDTLFRDAHTIKGAAGMLGFDDIRTLAHAVEDVLGAVRDTGVFPAELAAPLLRATGALRALVDGDGEPIGGLLDQLAAGQAAVLGSGAATAASAARRGPPARQDLPRSPAPLRRPALPGSRDLLGSGAPLARRRSRPRRGAAGPGGEDRPSARRRRRGHAAPAPADALAGRPGTADAGRA